MKRGAALNPPGLLATQDLKDRGWTPRLIAEFLGLHDQTRPNGLKMGRRKLPPVKLYSETRVEEAEREERFLLAQHKAMQARERAERARETRQARRRQRLEDVAQHYVPVVVPVVLRKGAVRKARAPYLGGLEAALGDFRRDLAAEKIALTEAEEKQLRVLLQERLDMALAAAYAWFPDPSAPSPQPSGAARPSDWRKWDWD